MNIRCPACAKQNLDPQLCTRCGCDLSALRDILEAALAQLHAGTTALHSRHWAAALDHAERSWGLHHSTHSARLACLAASALGDGTALARWRQQLSP